MNCWNCISCMKNRAGQCDNLHTEFQLRNLIMKSIYIYTFTLLAFLFGNGCAPEVGSEAWCKKIAEKPKGEWTGNEAAEYTKHCLFK